MESVNTYELWATTMLLNTTHGTWPRFVTLRIWLVVPVWPEIVNCGNPRTIATLVTAGGPAAAVAAFGTTSETDMQNARTPTPRLFIFCKIHVSQVIRDSLALNGDFTP